MTKVSSRERKWEWARMIAFVLLVLTVIVAIAFHFAGCTARTESPFSHAQVTDEQLRAEVLAAGAKAKADAEAAVLKARQEAAAEAQQLADAKAAKALAFKHQVAHVQRDAADQVAALEETYESDSAAADAAIARLGAAFSARLDAITAAAKSASDAIEAGSAAAFADLKRQQDQFASIGAVVQGISSGLGGVGGPVGIGAALLGTVGAWVFGRKAGAAGAQVQVDAEAQAHTQTLATVSKIVDALDVLKTKDPAVAAAFDANKSTLHEWLGVDGAKLVSMLRAGMTPAQVKAAGP